MPDNTTSLLQRLAAEDTPVWGYLWFILLAIWGGTANYISRIRRDKAVSFSIAELTGEWAISALAGLLTAYLCAEMEFSYYITAVAVAIAGHMGGRALFLIEDVTRRRFPGAGNREGGQ